ncbi:MAG TPA: L-histidine N(alpha)-methyltransferase [Steroidobacteraceae bacterium]|nr:L-histidine N(alpha)-methyltransferase [Steroidobacteraceae bacterium]
MSSSAPLRSPPGLHDHRPATRLLASDALRGLHAHPKRLAPLYFYDSLGSALFERICEQPEYYLTRTETSILRHFAGDIAQMLGEHVLLVEFGSGASAKTRLLLDRLMQPAAYVPVDISMSALLDAVQALRRDYPWLDVLPVCTDFTRPFVLPRSPREHARAVVFFPGSTIGNFDTVEAVRLMRTMRGVAGEGGALVIGVDLVKDPDRLEAAYDDRAGVTAAFNLNVLRRLNRELGADFDLEGFEHEAAWVAALSRIEMRLVSKRHQRVLLDGEAIEFAAGEHIVTEHSHKYTIESFERLARAAGWAPRKVWTDEAGDFSVVYLVAPAH